MEIDRAVQARIVRTLVSGQILAGLGLGATVAVGAILAADMAGEQFSGAATTSSTLGAALVAIPLARLAQRWGRRPALAIGAAIAALGSMLTIVAAANSSFLLLVLSFACLGVGTAVGLQARFAATDVATAEHRGRDLSLVVWSTTIGAVAGPNLIGPGEAIAEWLSLPINTGSFVFAVSAQLGAMVLYLVALRPDPLVLSRTAAAATQTDAASGAVRSRVPLIFAIASIAIGHAVMVSIMAMTPVHLSHHGASLTIIGFTISLHIAGMYALSPLFGWASDRFGRIPTILIGQALFAGAVLVVALGQLSNTAVTVGLVLLGLGWSASTVAGSAFVADLATGATKLRVQGRSDTIMSLSGALGGGLAGPILAVVGYAGLAWGAGLLVLIVTAGALIVLRTTTTPVTEEPAPLGDSVAELH